MNYETVPRDLKRAIKELSQFDNKKPEELKVTGDGFSIS